MARPTWGQIGYDVDGAAAIARDLPHAGAAVAVATKAKG